MVKIDPRIVHPVRLAQRAESELTGRGIIRLPDLNSRLIPN